MTYNEFRKHLVTQAVKQNVPIAGEFEITPYCNLKCKMCFVREDNKQKELSAKEWIEIIKQAKDAGLLFCLFTGGEIFTRKDFKQIYDATYDMGIRIVLFSNGTLINNEIVKMLVDRPPEYIAVTLYGASNEVYDKITGNKNGLDLALRGIKLLKANNINFIVRTIALKEIYQEMDQMIKLMKLHDFIVNYSLYVGPSRDIKNISCNPLDRLSPEEVIQYQKHYELEFGATNYTEFKYSDNGFNCVAGKSAYFITWYGAMTPCAMLEFPKVKLDRLNFLKTWDKFRELVSKLPNCQECQICEFKNECIQCPAKLYLENGFNKCSSYLKDIAKLRHEARNEKV